MKKKEKKKFKRKDLRLKNIDIDDLADFDADEIVENKQATTKIAEEGKTSLKSNLELHRGKILEIRTNYSCLVEIEGKTIECTLSGRLKQVNFETRNPVAVGDFVNVDLKDNPRIEEILPRKNSLSRFSENDFQEEVIIASNLDQVVITTSLKEPKLNLGLVDRYICSARLREINPVICVNKIDLAEDLSKELENLNFYPRNHIPIIYTSVVTGLGLTELKAVLKDRQSVFSGLSGTGKTSLINALKPGLNLKVSKISDFTSKGTHTTTSTRMIAWDFGGYLVDTPGIKTFGLFREDRNHISRIFPGFDLLYDKCKFADCSHDHEKNCAVKAAVEKGILPVERYDSYIRLLNSLREG